MAFERNLIEVESKLHIKSLGLCSLQEHMSILEANTEGKEALLVGLDYLINISFVPDDEVFKITLDYWNYFVPEVYSRFQTSVVEMNGGFAGFATPNGTDHNSRKRFFSTVLSRLRLLMISRMAKPEEVMPSFLLHCLCEQAGQKHNGQRSYCMHEHARLPNPKNCTKLTVNDKHLIQERVTWFLRGHTSCSGS